MKAGEPMRRTPIKRTPMKRGTSRMERGEPIKRKKPPKERARPERTAAEQAAMDRDGPTCQRCLKSLEDVAASKHHRKRRREVGADAVANIVLLCGSGTTGCHGWAHAHPNKARDEGWILWSGEDPAVKRCLVAAGCTGTQPEHGWYTAMVVYLEDGTKVVDPLPFVPLTAAGLPMWSAQ